VIFGHALRGGLKVCGDCLETPCPDQRAATQNGRCNRCTRQLVRDRRKRDRYADETPGAVYEMQEASSRDGEMR
jgi:hypothetical protein